MEYQLSNLPKELLIKIIMEQNLVDYFKNERQCNEQIELCKKKLQEIRKERGEIIKDHIKSKRLIPEEILKDHLKYNFEEMSFSSGGFKSEYIIVFFSYLAEYEKLEIVFYYSDYTFKTMEYFIKGYCYTIGLDNLLTFNHEFKFLHEYLTSKEFLKILYE